MQKWGQGLPDKRAWTDRLAVVLPKAFWIPVVAVEFPGRKTSDTCHVIR